MASPAYVSRRGAPLSIEALASHDCLAVLNRKRPASWHLDGPEGRTEIEVTGRFSANTVRSLFAAASAGLGIALLPALFARPAIQEGRLVRVLPEYGSRPVRVQFVHHSGARRPKAAAAFQVFASAKLLAQGIVERAGTVG